MGRTLSVRGVAKLAGTFLWPPAGHGLFPIVAAASATGEVPTEFWLLIKGVDARYWHERTATAVEGAS